MTQPKVNSKDNAETQILEKLDAEYNSLFGGKQPLIKITKEDEIYLTDTLKSIKEELKKNEELGKEELNKISAKYIEALQARIGIYFLMENNLATLALILGLRPIKKDAAEPQELIQKNAQAMMDCYKFIIKHDNLMAIKLSNQKIRDWKAVLNKAQNNISILENKDNLIFKIRQFTEAATSLFCPSNDAASKRVEEIIKQMGEHLQHNVQVSKQPSVSG